MIKQGDSRYALNIKNGYRYLPKGARRLLNLDSTSFRVFLTIE